MKLTSADPFDKFQPIAATEFGKVVPADRFLALTPLLHVMVR